MKEKLRHIEAFEYYYILGGKATDKNCSKVGVKFGVSCNTIWNWYKAFNWRERTEQRNIENSKKLAEKVDKAIVNSKADYRALIGKVVKRFAEKLKDGKIKISRPEDLNTMAKLDLLMMGEATEINKVDSFNEWIRQVNKKVKDNG